MELKRCLCLCRRETLNRQRCDSQRQDLEKQVSRRVLGSRGFVLVFLRCRSVVQTFSVCCLSVDYMQVAEVNEFRHLEKKLEDARTVLLVYKLYVNDVKAGETHQKNEAAVQKQQQIEERKDVVAQTIRDVSFKFLSCLLVEGSERVFVCTEEYFGLFQFVVFVCSAGCKSAEKCFG